MSGAPEPPILAMRLAEAMIFASSEPVTAHALLELLQDQQLMRAFEGETAAQAVSGILDALQASYADRGVRLVQVGGGWQFRTAPDLAPHLARVIRRPRRLPRSAMQTLSVIAYHQPCTRAEIEGIRGVSLAQATLDALLEAALIVPKGRKEVPGRPVLWGTSPAFLQHFGLRDLRDLPRREELMAELPDLATTPAPVARAGVPTLPVPAAPELC